MVYFDRVIAYTYDILFLLSRFGFILSLKSNPIQDQLLYARGMVKVGHQLPSSILCLISFGDKGKIEFAFRTPSILSKINQFNQTMPTLVLDLESSSIFIIIISLFGNN